MSRDIPNLLTAKLKSFSYFAGCLSSPQFLDNRLLPFYGAFFIYEIILGVIHGIIILYDRFRHIPNDIRMKIIIYRHVSMKIPGLAEPVMTYFMPVIIRSIIINGDNIKTHWL